MVKIFKYGKINLEAKIQRKLNFYIVKINKGGNYGYTTQ